MKVTRARVRESMQRTDPEGIAMRWLGITPRAVYSVRGPLSLWHIYGNHKLIRKLLPLYNAAITLALRTFWLVMNNVLTDKNFYN